MKILVLSVNYKENNSYFGKRLRQIERGESGVGKMRREDGML